MRAIIHPAVGIAVALAAAMLVGCESPVAGGGSDQPNALEARVVRPDGKTPAIGATARVVAGSFTPGDPSADPWLARVLAEVRTDSLGWVQLERPEGPWYLEVLDSVRHQVMVADTVTQGQSLILEPAASWSGTLTSTTTGAREVGLAGTARTAAIDENGGFRLPLLPGGAYRLLVRWDNSVTRDQASRRLGSGETVQIDTVEADGSVPLLDLARLPLRSALRGLLWPLSDTGSGKFFVTMDSGTSQVEPSDLAENPAAALRTDGHVPYLRMRMRLGDPVQVDTLVSDPWAGFGIGIAPMGGTLDATHVTALRLKLRGTGQIWVQLNTRPVEALDDAGHFGALLDLTPQWTWITLPVENLHPTLEAQRLGLTWTDVRHAVHAFVVQARSDSVEIDLADVRLSGHVAGLP